MLYKVCFVEPPQKKCFNTLHSTTFWINSPKWSWNVTLICIKFCQRFRKPLSAFSSSSSSSSSSPLCTSPQSFLTFLPSATLLCLLPLPSRLFSTLPLLILPLPLLMSLCAHLPPPLPTSLADSGRGPVDSPVPWKEAFIAPLCSALPEANGIQMWPSTLVTEAIYGERERERERERDWERVRRMWICACVVVWERWELSSPQCAL